MFKKKKKTTRTTKDLYELSSQSPKGLGQQHWTLLILFQAYLYHKPNQNLSCALLSPQLSCQKRLCDYRWKEIYTAQSFHII